MWNPGRRLWKKVYECVCVSPCEFVSHNVSEDSGEREIEREKATVKIKSA